MSSQNLAALSLCTVRISELRRLLFLRVGRTIIWGKWGYGLRFQSYKQTKEMSGSRCRVHGVYSEKKEKKWCDRSTLERKFKSGDQVFVKATTNPIVFLSIVYDLEISRINLRIYWSRLLKEQNVCVKKHFSTISLC